MKPFLLFAALFAALAASPAAASFRGYNLRHPVPETPDCNNLVDLTTAWAASRAERSSEGGYLWEGMHSGPANIGPFTGFVAWGYNHRIGFSPLFFVPTNVAQICGAPAPVVPSLPGSGDRAAAPASVPVGVLRTNGGWSALP